MSIIKPEVIVALATLATLGMVVVFHYEVIQLLNRWYRARQRKLARQFSHRPVILVVMFVLLLAHTVEIWLFGVAFHVLLAQEGYGAIQGYPSMGLLDCVYFSATNYTTVGWGDLVPAGHVRFLAGTEALVGFMMITWSASFSYLIMGRTWGKDDN